ncbi:MAG: hypothetical protein GXP14_14200 [Gammaproteobacteria bacterium]|nr:hypothetical protein [Gammaproteobacteria bacterium]
MDINLGDIREDAMYRINQSIFSIAPNADFTDFESQTKVLCNEFLILAAASLLADMKPSMFFLNLCRCAENWRRFSNLSQTCFHRLPTLLYNTPYYAAVIANDKQLIQKLINTMPEEWSKGEEYEAQFHETCLIMLLSANNVKQDKNVIKHLSLLEACEADSAQTILTKALLGLDELTADDFWAQFEISLYEHVEEIEERAQMASTSITNFAAYRFIWFKGLAWLRLAKIRGFEFPSSGYIYCPEEALLPMSEAYKGDWIIMPDMKL